MRRSGRTWQYWTKNRKHGHTGSYVASYEYRAWSGMKQLCFNPRRDGYTYVGAKGISMSARWQKSFKAFLRDIGDRPTLLHVLGRKDKKRGFTPSNVCWMTHERRQKGKSTSRLVAINGVKKSLVEWALVAGISKSTMHWRLANLPPWQWLKPRAKYRKAAT